MPTFLPPHKSGVHRIAAIALFRALLQQCRALPDVPSTTKDQLQNVVRHRFKSQRHVTSHKQLKVGFAAGYEAIDHLDAAVAGDASRKQVLLDLLERSPESMKRAPRNEVHEGEVRRDKRKEFNRIEAERREEGRRKLFERPLPLSQLSGGKRKIPILINANHIPMLRFKKPQSPYLSFYLTSRIKQRQRRHDLRHILEEERWLAREEDRWDGILGWEVGGEAFWVTGEGYWADAVGEALAVVQGHLQAEREKNRFMAIKMQGVVDREVSLKERERRDSEREEKGRRWAERRKAREKVRDDQKKNKAEEGRE